MKRIKSWLSASVLAVLSTATSASDLVHFRLPELSGQRLTLLASNPVGGDSVCVAGFAFDPEEAKATAIGLVLNARTADVKFVGIVKPAEALYQNRFTGCFELAGKVVFVEEADTQSSPQLSQVLVNLVSMKGAATAAVERRRLWSDGKRNWLVGLNSDGVRAALVVGHDPGQGASFVGMSVHQVTGATVVTSPAVTVKHGSFLPGSKVTLDGKGYLLAGPFARSGLEVDASLAKASISKAGNYIWAKPLPPRVFLAGPDDQGRLFQVELSENASQASIGEVAENATPGARVLLPHRDCVPQWLVPHVALLSKACGPVPLTIQYLADSKRRDLVLASPKYVFGPKTAVLYSPLELGAEGFSIGVITP